jgi:hypothetical protein
MTQAELNSFLAQAAKNIDDARTTGRAHVAVLTQEQATAKALAGATLIEKSIAGQKNLAWQPVNITEVKKLDDTAPNAKGDIYSRYQVRGIVEETGQSLTTWVIEPKDTACRFKQGDLAKFPVIKLPLGVILVDKKADGSLSFVETASHREYSLHNVSEKAALALNGAQQQALTITPSNISTIKEVKIL